MKDKLFYSTNSGQVLRQLGFGFDFSKPYYSTSVSSKRARLGISVSRLAPVLAVRSVVWSIVKAMNRPVRSVGKAFWIVISSPVV